MLIEQQIVDRCDRIVGRFVVGPLKRLAHHKSADHHIDRIRSQRRRRVQKSAVSLPNSFEAALRAIIMSSRV